MKIQKYYTDGMSVPTLMQPVARLWRCAVRISLPPKRPRYGKLDASHLPFSPRHSVTLPEICSGISNNCLYNEFICSIIDR